MTRSTVGPIESTDGLPSGDRNQFSGDSDGPVTSSHGRRSVCLRTLGTSTEVRRSNCDTERQNQRSARSSDNFVEAHSFSP
jgi:hypothetical protein